MSDQLVIAGPNYSAQLVDDIPRIVKNYRRRGMSEDAEALRAWRGMIQRARKFVLPANGHFFTQGKGLSEGVYPQRMPFPLIALEVPYPASVDVTHSAKSTKRLILCQEATITQQEGGYVVDNMPSKAEGFILSIFAYADKLREWYAQPCAGYVRYDTPTGGPDKASFPGEAWARGSSATFSFLRIPVLNQMWEQLIIAAGVVEAEKSVVQDTAEEVRIAFEFLQVLACRNVRQVEHAAPAKLNKRRAIRDKLPIDKFYTLRVGDVLVGRPRSSYNSESDEYLVREHYRSGHIRRLVNQSVWVSDTIVAAGSSAGRVVKRYAIPATL